MERYDFVFVVLTYKNIDDVVSFINNIKFKFKNYKIVVVNAHTSDEIDKKIEELSNSNDCDFVNIENKGYGYGNNKGIEFAKNKYKFSYLIIANPDTEVKVVNISDIKTIKKGIIAPAIKTLNGKNQNPYWVTGNKFTEWMIYYGCKHNLKLLKYMAFGINKIHREIFCFFQKKSGKNRTRVFAAHGSFLILTYDAVCKLIPLFDEDMFLFAEEAHLAHKAHREKVPIIYSESIKILHKEDGSINKTSINQEDISKKSIICYYEKLRAMGKSMGKI